MASQSLGDPGFPRFIADAVVASALPAPRLAFEIDESTMLDRLDVAVRFVNSVKVIGCRVLLDGFGGRRVSFVTLKVLRADLLRVDDSIVRNIVASPVAQTQLRAIILVSRTLGIDLIAEGVEDPEVLAKLKALGVRYARGYGISPPQPMDALIGKRGSPPRNGEAGAGTMDG